MDRVVGHAAARSGSTPDRARAARPPRAERDRTHARRCAGRQHTTPTGQSTSQRDAYPFADIRRPSSTPRPEAEGAVVTFRVADREEYRIRLTDPADITTARSWLAGESAPTIPSGVVVRGDADVNAGYTWPIDPDSLEFADVTTEVCDGLPSDVEKGAISTDRFCP